MAVASWLLGGRSLRSRRNHNNRHENDEDFVQLDSNKDAGENMYEILTCVTKSEGITEGRRLSYLVNFVKLVNKPDVNYEEFGYSPEEILYCLRPLAFHESTQLKNASFRAVRHFIKTEHHVDIYIKLKFDFLVARQITAAGIQLCRRVLCVCPSKFTTAPVQAMVALIHPNHSDNLQATALAFLAELAVLNPEVFVSCGGVSAVVRNLPYLKPKMTEALIAPLLYLINRPESREKAGINLHCLTDPVFMDRTLTSKRGGEGVRVSTTALVCLLRSWPGLLHLGQGTGSAISSIVNTLYISHLQRVMLSAIFEVFGLSTPEWTDDMASALEAVDPYRWQSHYSLVDGFIASEALGLYPHLAKARVNLVEVHLSLVLRTLLEANLFDAIVHVIVSDDQFKSINATILLGELLGLVHKWLPVEVTKLLPGLPNLISYSIRGRPVTSSNLDPDSPNSAYSLFHDAQVLEEGIEEATKSPTQDWSMASLLDVFSRRFSAGSSGDEGLACAEKRCRAQSAVRALARLSSLKRNSPSPSLYLSEMLATINPTEPVMPVLSGCLEECIKESGVLSMNDPLVWNWNTIQAVLKMGSEAVPKSIDSSKKSLFRRLVNFYLPGVGRFSKTPASSDKKSLSKLTLAALDLISLLLAAPPESDNSGLVAELLSGIKSCIVEILSSKSAYDCFLSPHACSNTHARDYFLMLGRFSRLAKGRQALEKSGIYPVLTDLILTTNHDCYIKLIVSALDYSQDENARKLLGKSLEAKSESGRLYVTRFLHSLLRVGLASGKLRDFVFYLLVLQLEDKKKAVAEYAVSVLQETTDLQEYVDCLVAQSPGLVCLGDQGHLLMVRLLSSPVGFKQMQQANFVNKELDKWANHFNFRYVGLVEGMLLEGMTHSSGSNRWQDSGRLYQPNSRELFLPPHLYQQLCTHTAGRQLVLSHPNIPILVQLVLEPKWSNDIEVLSLKAALYALSGIIVYLDNITLGPPLATAEQSTPNDRSTDSESLLDISPIVVGESTPNKIIGIVDSGSMCQSQLTTAQRCVAAVMELATKCPVYSIRGVAYTALSNLATSKRGVHLLSSHGWYTAKHDRHEKWPLILNEALPAGDSLHHHDESSDTSSEFNKSNSLIEDTILEDDCSSEFFWGIPGGKTQRVRERRWATLPPPQTQQAHMHLRSYSESKATDPTNTVIDNDSRGDWSGRKTRSNSYTDSTTSADSYYNMRHHSFSERQRVVTLSPIQSVSSLCTLKQSSRLRFNLLSQSAVVTGKIKRSSESVLKTLAPPSPYPEGLITYGDLLRMDSGTPSRLEASQLDPDEADFSVIEDSPSGSMDCTVLHSHPDSNRPSSSFPHLTTQNKPGMLKSDDERGSCYLGICMPEKLSTLFPNHDRMATNNHVAFVAKVLHSHCLEDLKNPYFHREICFLGSRGIHNTMVSTSESDSSGYVMTASDLDLDKEPLQDNDSDSDIATDIPYIVEQPMPIIFKSPVVIRSEILRMVEQLSNPLLHKTCKQSLLQMKQAHGDVFKEICVLSDVCHILSICHVRVLSREMIHELFDSGSEVIWQDAQNYLEEVNRKRGFNELYLPSVQRP